MKRDLIRDITKDSAAYDGREVTLGGWARSIRDSRAFGFIDLNDGSSFKGVQIVFEREKTSGVGTCTAEYRERLSENGKLRESGRYEDVLAMFEEVL